jgi:hypothetical protein
MFIHFMNIQLVTRHSDDQFSYLNTVGLITLWLIILSNILQIRHLTSVYNFMVDVMNTGQKLSIGPPYLSMLPELMG